MPQGWLQTFVRGLCRQLNADGQPGVSDAQLLGRWVCQRDEAAFELLLRRHAPMVFGVCQRVLHDARDAEDAFQAAFLLLLRKAGGIRHPQALGAWLHRTALRVALRARQDRLRCSPSAPLEDVPADQPDDLVWRDLRPVLDEEIGRLPERYRLPFVLCNLQGKTNQEAADELGCPLGTILSRLHWARGRLRARLERRGVTASAALLALLLERCAAASVPVPLLQSCFSPAVLAQPATRAAELAEGVLRSMFVMKLKCTAAVLAFCGVVTLSVWNVSGPAAASPEGPSEKKTLPAPPLGPPKPDQSEPPPRNWVLLSAQQSGRIELIARELRKGEAPPKDRIILGGEDGTKQHFRLKEGDRVEAGELVGRIEGRLARKEIEIRNAKLLEVEAQRKAVEKTHEEAKVRYDRLRRVMEREVGSVGVEEVAGAKLTWERYAEELKGKEASVITARLEIERAKILLQMHDIRSPVRGTIHNILLKPGETVKELEGVIRIKIEEK